MTECTDELAFLELFQAPENTPIWRYMDLSQFIYILMCEQLYFTNLAELDDIYEGSVKQYFAEHETDITRQQLEEFLKAEEILRREVYVNCWHINKDDSAALWQIHMKSNEGVAIKTTVGNLKETIKQKLPNYPFYAYPVVYDIKNMLLKTRTISWTKAIFTKRPCFDFEKELRVVVRQRKSNQPPGFTWPIDPDKLIEEIWLNPDAEDWLLPLIKKLAKHFKVTTDKIYKSKIKKELTIDELISQG